jgi:hypothetical protein
MGTQHTLEEIGSRLPPTRELTGSPAPAALREAGKLSGSANALALPAAKAAE